MSKLQWNRGGDEAKPHNENVVFSKVRWKPLTSILDSSHLLRMILQEPAELLLGVEEIGHDAGVGLSVLLQAALKA